MINTAFVTRHYCPFQIRTAAGLSILSAKKAIRGTCGCSRYVCYRYRFRVSGKGCDILKEGDRKLAPINMMGFGVVTAVTMKIGVLCDVVPRSLVDTCRRFRRTFCIISVD